MPSFISLIALGASLASIVSALPQIPLAPASTASEAFTYSTGYFEQLLDHDNPDAGTFMQRYFYSTTYWKGPGSPVSARESFQYTNQESY